MCGGAFSNGHVHSHIGPKEKRASFSFFNIDGNHVSECSSLFRPFFVTIVIRWSCLPAHLASSLFLGFKKEISMSEFSRVLFSSTLL